VELDAKTLSQIREIGGEELLARLARLFLEHTPLRLEEVRRGLAAGDWSRISRAIHSLRSSSVTLGAVDLARTAAELEAMAGEENREQLEAALPGLAKKAELALRVLEKLTAGSKA
jgi:HPt (histidine-containing phosphotransfer) domain-containing protein